MKQEKKKQNVLPGLLIPETRLRDAMELYPGKSRAEVRRILWNGLKKKLLPGVVLAVCFLVLAVLSGGTQEKTRNVKRPAPGSAETAQQLKLKLEEEWQEFTLLVGAMEYGEAELEAMHTEAEEYLEQAVLGENEGLDRITKDMVFPTALSDTGLEIGWSTDAPWYISTDGKVQNETLTEPVQVEIKAEIFYGTEVRYFVRLVTLYPPEYTKEEALLYQVQQELSALEKADRTSEWFYLPETVSGYPLEPVEETGGGLAAFLVLLAGMLPLLLYAGYFSTLDDRRKKWKEQAERSYMEFVTKLSLLLAAGISLRQAFIRLSEEYEARYGSEHVLAAELKVARQELDNGHSEAEVYEAFGRRIGVLAYRRMASLLEQNVSRGVQGMRNLLLQEAKEVMAQDKANIRVRGEQAGTKLLFPMMGLLFLVFAILLVPAFQSF